MKTVRIASTPAGAALLFCMALSPASAAEPAPGASCSSYYGPFDEPCRKAAASAGAARGEECPPGLQWFETACFDPLTGATQQPRIGPNGP